MTNKTDVRSTDVAEGPALAELLESGIDCVICVFKLATGGWLEGFAESVDFDGSKAIIRFLNAHDGQRYLIEYSPMTRAGRVLERV